MGKLVLFQRIDLYTSIEMLQRSHTFINTTPSHEPSPIKLQISLHLIRPPYYPTSQNAQQQIGDQNSESYH
jgi:hypothetical protein